MIVFEVLGFISALFLLFVFHKTILLIVNTAFKITNLDKAILIISITGILISIGGLVL